MPEAPKEDRGYIPQALRTLGSLCTRQYWQGVGQEYRQLYGENQLASGRLKRAAQYIFTAEGQIAYKYTKAKYKAKKGS